MTRFWKCRRWRRRFPEALWSEERQPRDAALAVHLDSCAGCAAEYAEMAATLRLLTAPPATAPRFEHLWTRLAVDLDRVDREGREGRRWPERLRRPAATRWVPVSTALAAAALFALGLLAGRALWRPQPAPPAPEIAARVAALEARLDRYLDRATPILLAISNRSPEEAGSGVVGMAEERALALELAVEAAALRQELRGRRPGRGGALVNDLERIFLQVANLPEGEYAEGMALVRSTLERESILLDLSLQRLRGEARQRRSQV
jgi:hypothetical protein